MKVLIIQKLESCERDKDSKCISCSWTVMNSEFTNLENMSKT